MDLPGISVIFTWSMVGGALPGRSLEGKLWLAANLLDGGRLRSAPRNLDAPPTRRLASIFHPRIGIAQREAAVPPFFLNINVTAVDVVLGSFGLF